MYFEMEDIYLSQMENDRAHIHPNCTSGKHQMRLYFCQFPEFALGRVYNNDETWTYYSFF
jgi:hypothetical protein